MERIQRLTLGLVLILFTELSLAIVIENEELLTIPDEESNLVLDAARRGWSSFPPAENEPCHECYIDASREYDRYAQYTYLTYYDSNPNITNQNQLAGIRTCRGIQSVVDCYDQCIASDISAEEIDTVTNSLRYKAITKMNGLYCEGRYTPGYASCRLADTHRCDKIKRNTCGDRLDQYSACVNETLYLSGQDCSGDCTPARRFLKAQRFIWDTECGLQATYKTQCKDIVTYDCFAELKDTETNYGIFQRMDTLPEMANNLTYACSVMESPFPCIETATNGFYDYFGFNVTYACRGAERTMESIKAHWRLMIEPFCGANVSAEYEVIADVCPTPDPANAPPEVPIHVPLTTTTTTRGTWEEYQPKTGRCPVSNGAPQRCSLVCGDDSHCFGNNKCCENCCRQPLIRSGGSGGGPRFSGGASKDKNAKPSSSRSTSSRLHGFAMASLLLIAYTLLLC